MTQSHTQMKGMTGMKKSTSIHDLQSPRPRALSSDVIRLGQSNVPLETRDQSGEDDHVLMTSVSCYTVSTDGPNSHVIPASLTDTNSPPLSRQRRRTLILRSPSFNLVGGGSSSSSRKTVGRDSGKTQKIIDSPKELSSSAPMFLSLGTKDKRMMDLQSSQSSSALDSGSGRPHGLSASSSLPSSATLSSISSPPPFPFFLLPLKVQRKILLYLSLRDIGRLSLVNREFLNSFKDCNPNNSPLLGLATLSIQRSPSPPPTSPVLPLRTNSLTVPTVTVSDSNLTLPSPTLSPNSPEIVSPISTP